MRSPEREQEREREIEDTMLIILAHDNGTREGEEKRLVRDPVEQSSLSLPRIEIYTVSPFLFVHPSLTRVLSLCIFARLARTANFPARGAAIVRAEEVNKVRNPPLTNFRGV